MFTQILAIVVGIEGGLSMVPTDRGNWTGGIVGVGVLKGTKFGISAASYPREDIAGLTVERASAIYERDYWAPIRGDEMPPGLALVVFDAAVNAGVTRAVKWLQGVVGTSVDGRWGEASSAALKAVIAKQGEDVIAAEFTARRLNFMATEADWAHNGLGWARRLCKLPYLSKGLATTLLACNNDIGSSPARS